MQRRKIKIAYKIKKITFTDWFDFDKEFYLIIDNQEIFINRGRNKRDVEEFLNKVKNINYKDGYFKLWGNSQHPLDELDKSLCPYPAFTNIKKIASNVWEFMGIHNYLQEGYHRGFCFIIWNEKIAKKIENFLSEIYRKFYSFSTNQ